MAKRYPREFRDDVVRAARQRQGPLTQVARDFGISDATLYEWMRKADVEDGVRLGRPRPASCASFAAATGSWNKKSRSRCAQRPTSPRALPQNDLPAGPRAGR